MVLADSAATPAPRAVMLVHSGTTGECVVSWCCTPLGRSADADAVVTQPFPGALEPQCRTWMATLAVAARV